MNNYIVISGLPLWICLGILFLIFICMLILGINYIRAEKERQKYKEKYRNLLHEYNVVALDLELRGRGVIGNKRK